MLKSHIKISGKVVGQNCPTFVVFEAGPTHNGLASAKELVRASKKAGAAAIKFQIAEPAELIADPSLQFTYGYLLENGATSTTEESLLEIWRRRSMSQSDWIDLKKYCDKVGISFFATVFSEAILDFVLSLGVDSIKVASQDINHKPLIKACSSTGLPVQIDTGGSSIGEIEEAIEWITEEGNSNIIINHCPTGYPARLESVNLRMIPSLKKLFGCPIAFSDHNSGHDLDVAAVSLGADILEKTITLDRYQKSPEHMVSLLPAEMGKFVGLIRDVETALGFSRRSISEQQRLGQKAVRRSAYAARPLKAGELLDSPSVKFKRPGFGIAPNEIENYFGSRLVSAVPEGEPIERANLEINFDADDS